MRKLLLLLPLIFGGLFAAFPSFAKDGLSVLTVTTTDTGQEYSAKIQILIMMTLIGFIPTALLMCTSFARFIIVFSLLRQALGLQQSPPNQILVGIALAMTLLIMRPVGNDIYENAYTPYINEDVTFQEALLIAKKPVTNFMLNQTSAETLARTLEIAGEPADLEREEIPFLVLLPSFVLSEIKTAFEIGFMIFLPFIAIDLIVATVLMSLGLMMLSPLIISLPLKICAFVLFDGWNKIIGSLTQSFWM
ncbi:flagellar biosynthetic protein FliP (plasmid) [Vibrio breoganii]|uniref:Flagellar biosynthetic protein FliP n=1 Tax=Vibrio breoganii TaxID=553239 RepID=A0AAN1CU18_9VIBR|nr:flagellar type III secretion system pore protein FliP [Vibrio breoganii]ANO35286.1 flagellar biosynthetic protein FliP [Vibrio breoganii]